MKKVNIAVFLIMLAAAFIVIVTLPPDGAAEEYENRSMARMPDFSRAEIFGGAFIDKLEAFLCDNAAYRTAFLRFASSAERLYGIPPSGAEMVAINADDIGLGLLPDFPDAEDYTDDGIDAYINEETGGGATPETTPEPAPEPEITGPEEETEPGEDPETEPAPEPAPETDPEKEPETEPEPEGTPEPETPPPPVSNRRVNPAEPFGVDINFNENAVLYEGYTERTSTVGRYAQILNAYRAELPENIRVFSLLAPIRVEFMDEKYRAANDSQLETINKINELLDGGITAVNAYASIAAHASEYVYFRTDHHWTALGAYYAYLAFADAAGFAPVTIDNYVENSIRGYIGSLGKGTANKTITDNPDTLYYYKIDNGVTFSRNMFYIPEDLKNLSYRVFLGGDYAKLDFTSSNKNGRVIVIVKDSYANALVPWLSPNYERIIVIDPRQYEGGVVNLLKGFEQADLLFVDYVAATAMWDFVEAIYNIK